MYTQPPYYPPPEPDKPKRRTTRLQLTAAILSLFAVAVGMVILTQRLSNETLAVLAGTICGVGAAIPTSLLIIAITRRRDKDEQPTRREAPQPAYPYAAQPPMIVIAPPGYQQQAPPPRPQPTMGWTDDQRTFTVIGQNTPASRWDDAGWGDDPQ